MKARRLTAIITAAVMALPLLPARAEDARRVVLDPSKESPFNGGEFEGWGTSMGWWGNRLGHSDKMAQQAAEDLYSEDGLGLDIVRYNVGGGDDPTHNHINRSDSKLPCFAVPQYENGAYSKDESGGINFVKDENGDVVYDWDWDADHDQMNVLKRIKEQNPDVHIEGYTNSPPWFMTKSGCSGGGVNKTENLDPSNYDVFANFLVEVTKHMEETGLPFDSYSPMNEPNPGTGYWSAFSPKQEGNLVAVGEHQSGLIKALKDAYTAAGIDTLVAGPDETSIDYSISSYNALTDEAKAALDRLDTHTYGGSNRAGLKQTAIDAGKNLWMSEVDGGWNGFGLANQIITDLNGMQASAWVMWDIVDFHRDADFVDPTTGNKTEANNTISPASSLWGVGMGNHDTETIEWANKYYAYGQFTKYINPGDTLIASSNSTLAAYNKETGDIKIVVNNSGSSDIPYEFDLSAFKSAGSSVKEIRTNNASNPITSFSAGSAGLSYSYDPEAVSTGDAYFAVYDADGVLKYVSKNKPSDTLTGDYSGCTHKLFAWNTLKPSSGAFKYDPNNQIERWKEITGEAAVEDNILRTTAKAGTITTYIVEGGGAAQYAVVTGCDGELLIGGTVKMTLDTNITDAPTWSVDDDTVAEINESTGELTIKKSGTVTVTAAFGSFKASKTLTVPLTITGGGTELHIGDEIQMSCNVAEGYDGDVTWAVDNEEAAEITQSGLLTVKGSGTVTVTVTVEGVTAEKTFVIPEYTLSGTASWGNDSNAPKDSDDYRKAADGKFDTYFDGNQNGYVMYDYGTPYKISKVRLAARDGYADRTKGGKVQGSNDAIAWTDLYTAGAAIPAGQYTDVTTFESDKAYRYYRYTNPDNMTNIAEFLIEGAPSEDIPEGDPTVNDISELSDNFEHSANIFGAPTGTLAEDGNQIYACGLERFGNVFVPVKTTGTVTLENPIELTDKDRFRISFNMFAGWEDGGKDNTFALKDKDGNEIVALYLTGGGYNLTELRIDGKNVLDAPAISQSRSNPGTNKAGANGWNNSSGQGYRNNMGFNKTAEIIIDGTGTVKVSFTGGMADTVVESVIRDKALSIGSMELTGDYNTARDRAAAYDNFDADVITYKEALPEPPKPTDPPTLPDDGTLISLDFDGDLESGSAYGTATAVGTAKFATVDDKQVLELDNSNDTAVKLTDANGNGLLAGQDEITVSFSVKPTEGTKASWWFYSAPDDNTQGSPENYIGIFRKPDGKTLSVERYQNGRSDTTDDGDFTLNQWHNVVISFAKNKTTLYVDGAQKDSDASAFVISDMLGTNPVAYIGRANWGTDGEFATGYIDDFKIVKGALKSALDEIDLGDVSAVKENLTLPTDSGVTWESSNPGVISNTGAVTRPLDTTDATLTASVTENGVTFTRKFTVTVTGLAASAETFTAYAEGTTIKYTSEYGTDDTFALEVTLTDAEGVKTGESKAAATGEFTGLAKDKTYKVSYILKDNASNEVKKTVTKTVAVKDEIKTAAYLFAHFMNTEGDADDEQIYFSVSEDGTNWTTLNGGKPVLMSDVGEQGVRDPYILRGEDGKFFIIATDLSIYNLGLTQGSNKWGYSQTNGSKNIVVWESDDLVNWSDANLVKVAVDNAGCTWAPEAVYDREKGRYMVFWASKTATDNYATQRMYRSYTSDFKTFTEPEIYIDGGTVSNIDTTIVEEKGVYYRFTKNESNSSVTMMKANFLDGPWKDVKTYSINGVAGNTVTGYEGPAVYKNIDGGWTMLLDFFSKSQGYKPFVTDDLSTGIFTSAGDFKFDGTYRHGTVLPITAEEYKAVTEKYK